ncbi:tyrosinase family protein [Lysobacter enzymogenes]|uniref:Tyrosinase family protein n=1 Tax=Lysobacter enzymogenes TaxID=69 RepID=A0A3N2RH78_LYSEN|nr:tyrosinase family protein [Lysobacter enzymogenes]ROU06686.1 tyrosinase family protein [Lysobacter enzymogenes]
MHYTRREFLTTAASAAGAAMLPLGPALAAATGSGPAAAPARYRRYDVASAEGQKMLASYARGIQAMLELPVEDPRNWFRYAFVHFFDCPHGNWWFYVWHRGYIGYFEQIVRELSGDPDFALPYWDWTRHPRLPAGMFEGVLSPTDRAYAPFTGNLKRFTDFIQPTMRRYFESLDGEQRAQLKLRGYATFDDAWCDVNGYYAAKQTGLTGNQAFAVTCAARYPSADNPGLDWRSRFAVSPLVVGVGLLPTKFQADSMAESFTSPIAPSHLVQPASGQKFSILENYPHNKVHNYLGGVHAIDPGPYGNMTNFLSPVDPIFFLHHANMDRLWEVWTRRQRAHDRPILPEGKEAAQFMDEPFRFYIDAAGKPVGPSTAGQYVDPRRFDYDYGPGGYEGFSFDLGRNQRRLGASADAAVQARLSAGVATLAVPAALVENHLDDAAPLVAEITIERPDELALTREFDVLVNAPADMTEVGPDSPYYAGTLAYFGPTMPGMKMSHNTTFAVPLPKTLRALTQAASANSAAQLNIRVVPAGPLAAEPVRVNAVSVRPAG